MRNTTRVLSYIFQQLQAISDLITETSLQHVHLSGKLDNRDIPIMIAKLSTLFYRSIARSEKKFFSYFYDNFL